MTGAELLHEQEVGVFDFRSGNCKMVDYRVVNTTAVLTVKNPPVNALR